MLSRRNALIKGIGSVICAGFEPSFILSLLVIPNFDSLLLKNLSWVELGQVMAAEIRERMAAPSQYRLKNLLLG